MSTSITIDRLRKTYGAFVAVDDLTIEIPPGTVFGLLGPNGAGKSTTFKAMLGLIRPQSGEVRYGGSLLAPAVLENVAYVPERSVLYDWMTVAEHVEMTRRAFKRFSSKAARELLQDFHIDPRKKARALSKGMRTAVMVALAIARHSDILILDEPTSGLDPVNQRSVLNHIVSEAARGATIIFSSHQIGQVERAADRIAVLDRGKLVLEGSVDDLKYGRKIVEGIFPTTDFSLDGLVNDARLIRVDRTGRVVRLLTRESAPEFSATLERLGAGGVRTVDLNLEDIFLYAVSSTPASADAVEGA